MEQHRGVIVKVFGLYYTVDDGTRQILCFLKGKNRINRKFRKYTNPVAVGDNVLFHHNADGSGSIIDMVDRKNLFSRKDKGRNAREDVIAANLDVLLIIQSFMDPVANPRFVDRLAVQAIKEGILPVLCMNKLDLASVEMVEFIEEYYEHTGLEILYTSAEEQKGLDVLKELLIGKRTLLAGNSGVGKSTLINCIYPDLDLAVTETSEKTGKGKHTTTNVILYQKELGTQLIDSPGVREFGLVDMEPEELTSYFYDFNQYRGECKFDNCTHEHEPGCKIKEMADNDEISYERYVSYLQMLSSLYEYRENKYR